MNMSIAAMSVRWLRRKLRQVEEGAFGRHGRYLPTVPWLSSMPSLSMRGGEAHPEEQITVLGVDLGPSPTA
jgi:hypothetical protein